MSTYTTHPYQGAAKETSRLMLRLGNGCNELNVVDQKWGHAKSLRKCHSNRR
jgi:hypothetical protein